MTNISYMILTCPCQYSNLAKEYLYKENRMLKRIAYIFIQCTWGAVQSLLGLIAMLLLGRQKHCFYRCAVLTEYDIDSVPKYMRWLGCVSLGMFIFVGTHKGASHEQVQGIISHEYGHTLQSLLLGPLYLIMVGAPSFIWCRHYGKHRGEYAARGISYYSRYPEKQATALGLRAEKRKI